MELKRLVHIQSDPSDMSISWRKVKVVVVFFIFTLELKHYARKRESARAHARLSEPISKSATIAALRFSSSELQYDFRLRCLR